MPSSSSSPSSQKRCLYDVLGLSKDCLPDEIRSAYKRLALQRHPDKLMKTGGLTEPEATAQFQELVHAYEVLSDPKERAWYDSHRSQILFSDRDSKSSGVTDLPDLFSFFSNSVYSSYSDTGRGFYKVYMDVFDKIFRNEVHFARTLGLRMDSVREAPVLGNLESPYAQVTAFYNYWLGFSTVMDFCWVDQYDAALGVNRKSRRVMEEENKKLRRKARREFNETVRGLADFVKKRDKRVIDMGLKRNAEMEKKKEEERERRKKIEKERLERAKNYKDPDWAKVEEEEGINGFEDEDSDKKNDERNELYCVVCSKKFKSEKQWRNHEQSKKHKEKVVELRKSFSDEESNEEEEEIIGGEESSTNVDGVNEKLKEGLKIDDDEDEETEEHENWKNADQVSDGKEEFYDVDDEDKDEAGGIEDDEMSMLKNMVSGHKNRRKNTSSTDRTEILKTDVQAEIESDEAEFPEYNNRKSKRRNRKDKREKAQKIGERGNMSDAEDAQNPYELNKGNQNGQKEDSASDEVPEHKSEDEADGSEILENQVQFKNGNKEEAVMEHDNRKGTRKSRRAKKEKSKKVSGGSMADVVDETKSPYETANMNDNRNMDESASGTFVGNGFVDQTSEPNRKASHHSLNPASAKSTRSAKGKKAKASAVNSGNMCDTCGEAFESRTKLHKHLGDTGHATLKFRR